MQTNTAIPHAVLDPVQTDSGVRFVKVRRVVNTGTVQPVYNMEVEHHHNFAVQGGMIVHNCIDSTRYALERMINMREAKTFSY